MKELFDLLGSMFACVFIGLIGVFFALVGGTFPVYLFASLVIGFTVTSADENSKKRVENYREETAFGDGAALAASSLVMYWSFNQIIFESHDPAVTALHVIAFIGGLVAGVAWGWRMVNRMFETFSTLRRKLAQ